MSERILNSDAELVELFQSARADEAFNRIVLKYQERMYLLARRFVQTHDEADDIVQEALVRAHGALANFHGDSSLWFIGEDHGEELTVGEVVLLGFKEPRIEMLMDTRSI